MVAGMKQRGEQRWTQPIRRVGWGGVRRKVNGLQEMWGWRAINWKQIEAWVGGRILSDEGWESLRRSEKVKDKWMEAEEWWGDRRSPADIEAGSRIGLAGIQACGGPGGWQESIVNEARERQSGGEQRGQFGWESRGRASSWFGWYDWEMIGILPGWGKQSVMLSLTTGDCQRGGAAVTERV